eukprot:jgi/Tetstr1/437822/TSEL_026462.t1
MEAVLAHPAWWGPEQRLGSLSRLCHLPAGKGRGGLRYLLHGARGSFVIGGSGWTEAVDGAAEDGLQRPPHSMLCGDSVPQLL